MGREGNISGALVGLSSHYDSHRLFVWIVQDISGEVVVCEQFSDVGH